MPTGKQSPIRTPPPKALPRAGFFVNGAGSGTYREKEGSGDGELAPPATAPRFLLPTAYFLRRRAQNPAKASRESVEVAGSGTLSLAAFASITFNFVDIYKSLPLR